MILDPNGMPILQPTVDNAETATFNDAFAAIGNALAGVTEYITALLERSTTAYSLPNGAYTQLTGTQLTTVSALGATVSGGAITVPVDGVYQIDSAVSFVANGAGGRQFTVNKNSTSAGTNAILFNGVAGTSTSAQSVAGSKRIPLLAGDVIRMFIYQNSGGPLELPVSPGWAVGTYLQVSLIPGS